LNGPRWLWLSKSHASVDSFERLLLLGRAEARQLDVVVESKLALSATKLRCWTNVLSALGREFFRSVLIARVRSGLPRLEEISVRITRTRCSSWVVHLLRDFLPSMIAEFSSSSDHDYRLFASHCRPDGLEKALIDPTRTWRACE
jgi:hypothetical protein